jgi:hypothetical protein
VKKIAQNVAQPIKVPKIVLNIWRGKQWPTILGNFCRYVIYERMAKVNNLTMGENSTILATLLPSKEHYERKSVGGRVSRLGEFSSNG